MAKSKAKKKSNNGNAFVGNKQAWKLMRQGATVAAAFGATKLTALAWKGITGKQPPSNPADPSLKTSEAIIWAIAAGAIAELSKVLTSRAVTTYWVRSTGELPPGVKANEFKAEAKK